MNKTTTFLVSRGGLALVGLLLFATMALAGCAEPAAIAAVLPTATVYAPPPTPPPPEPPEPTPAALSFPLSAPEKQAVEVASDRTCVACHTNQQTLQALAKEEEEVAEALSEGEG